MAHDDGTIDAALSIGDALAADLAELDPLTASEWGLRTTDLPTFDPEWWQARRALFAAGQHQLARCSPTLNSDVLADRAAVEVDWVDSGEAYGELHAAMDSPLFRLRFALDNMPTATEDDWADLAERLAQMPRALGGLRRSYDLGRRSDRRAARRQVLTTASAIDGWVGPDPAASAFVQLVRPAEALGSAPLSRRLEASALAAAIAFTDMALYLREDYAGDAIETDAVGSERFALWARRYSGTSIDASDCDWAADQLADLGRDREALGAEVEAADPELVVTGRAEHLAWVEGEIERAATRSTAAFAVPPGGWPPIAVRPMDGAGGQQAYYAPAVVDGALPATVWIDGGEGPHHVEFEKTLIFHESIPGHHVEAVLQSQATHLSRFQQVVYLPGHSEGWGLYAERLAEELGLIDTPRARLGALGSRALRLVSLLFDVGLHTGVAPPGALGGLAGDAWTVEGAAAVVAAQGLDPETARWWVTNAIGRPAHRASYATGERAWLEARRRAVARGEALAAFHGRLLGAGPMGLDLLAAQ